MFYSGLNKTKKDLIIKILLTLGCVLVLFIPFIALAESSSDVSVINIDLPNLGPTDIVSTIRTIIKYLLLGAIISGIVYLIFAGYHYITSGGNPDQMAQAKNRIIGVVIGLVVVLSSYALVTFVEGVVSGRLTEISFNLHRPTTQTPTDRSSESGERSDTDSPNAEENLPEVEPLPEPPNVEENADCPYTQEEIDSCFKLATQMYMCFNKGFSFLNKTNSPCQNQNNLSTEGQKACQNLRSLVQQLGRNLETSESYDICGTPGNKIISECLLGDREDPSACEQKVDTLINTITTSRSSTEAPAERTPPEEEKEISPYQACLQEAKTKHDECTNATENICLVQKRAYEVCLKGLGWIIRSFCNARRRDYYECRNNWLRKCSQQYSNDREYCRIHYNPY